MVSQHKLKRRRSRPATSRRRISSNAWIFRLSSGASTPITPSSRRWSPRRWACTSTPVKSPSYLIRGKLELRICEEENTLGRGDAIYFDSELPHGYRRIGNAPCAALVVTVPWRVLLPREGVLVGISIEDRSKVLAKLSLFRIGPRSVLAAGTW